MYLQSFVIVFILTFLNTQYTRIEAKFRYQLRKWTTTASTYG